MFRARLTVRQMRSFPFSACRPRYGTIFRRGRKNNNNQRQEASKPRNIMSAASNNNNNNNAVMEEQQHRELMEFLTDNSGMRDTARSALKQAMWSGAGAVAGGLMLGPIGGLVGGIGGSVIGFLRADEYNGVVQHLGELPPQQRGHLVEAVGKVLVDAGASPAELTAPGVFQARLVEFASRGAVRDQIWRACMDVMQEEGTHAASLTS